MLIDQSDTVYQMPFRLEILRHFDSMRLILPLSASSEFLSYKRRKEFRTHPRIGVLVIFLLWLFRKNLHLSWAMNDEGWGMSEHRASRLEARRCIEGVACSQKEPTPCFKHVLVYSRLDSEFFSCFRFFSYCSLGGPSSQDSSLQRFKREAGAALPKFTTESKWLGFKLVISGGEWKLSLP